MKNRFFGRNADKPCEACGKSLLRCNCWQEYLDRQFPLSSNPAGELTRPDRMLDGKDHDIVGSGNRPGVRK